jgi:hypothetical protein
VNYRTNLEIISFSILINFEELSFTSLNVSGLFLNVFNHLEILCYVRNNKAGKHVIKMKKIRLKNCVSKSS